ncbi:uncharacterized protein K02A2.6-like [Ornithodoros turicata]|uniref:uncharacterized protein K02A2.6-like n=1 Tax=Ornithodoros turicata TaxID=34597 RepID=UPI0031399468
MSLPDGDTQERSTFTASLATFNVTPPEPFTFKTPNDWPTWRKRFLRFRAASGLNDKAELSQVDALIYIMGEQAEYIYATLKLSPEDARKFDKVLEAFDAYFVPRRNIIFERAKFNTRVQQDGESVEEFVTVLHSMADLCNYGALREELIRDRLVAGLRDKKVSEQLQLDSELTLQKAITAARQRETVRLQQADLHKGNDATVHRLTTHKVSPGSDSRTLATRKIHAGTTRPSSKSASQKLCRWCGRDRHARQDCPAKDKICSKCKKKGHFSSVCLSAKQTQSAPDGTTAFLGVVAHGGTSKWQVPVLVQGIPLTFKVDTGADETVILESVFLKHFTGIRLEPPKRRLRGPDGKMLKVTGMTSLQTVFQGQESQQDIYVLKELPTCLLGQPAIDSLKVIPTIQMLSKASPFEEYATVFQGLGVLQGDYDTKLAPDARPFALSSPRRVPLPLYQKTKEELQRMEKLGVITPVMEPTAWCAPMVTVPKKSGGIRLCIDFTQLNRYVLREFHPIPSVEHSLAMLKNAKVFSKLDANSGFWQIPLSEQSKHLTTFITPFGRYSFNRLPFGISSAPEHFQKRVATLLKDLHGVLCHMDDILIWGANQIEHDHHLEAVMTRIQEAGMSLNKDKCICSVSQVTFLGHIVDGSGIRPDEEKVNAILKMTSPTDKTGLRRLLGMATYLTRFVPKVAELLQPLSCMLSSKQEFVWGAPQQEAFQKWKEILSTSPVLGIYDPAKETVVTADASSFGLGAVLRQKQDDGKYQVIAYASRILADVERRYAQIEKEGLALLWASEKFRDYLIGKKFLLETDHKPLVSLFSTKQLHDLTPRLQRMRMRLMRYTYEITYVPGKDLLAADALSRTPLRKTDGTDLTEEIECFVHYVETHLPGTARSLLDIQQEQEKDETCQHIIRFTRHGWPTRRDLGQDLKPFWLARHQLAVADSLLMHGTQIVIPKTCQQQILQLLHEGHFGLEKCTTRAKHAVWWPSINDDIAQTVKNCHECLQLKTNRKLPLITTDFPDRPWQKIAMDLFHCQGSWWLIVVDYYSRYPELVRLHSLSREAIVNHCKSIFARHGIPEVVISDNGPQFSQSSSSPFARFSTEYGFRHVTSSPGYPQSNGLAEVAVKIVKMSMKKTKDPYKSLLAYRASPLKNGYSPAELLMGRRLRTNVPVAQLQLVPYTPDYKKVAAFETKNKRDEERHYNRGHGVRELPPLGVGTDVWVIDLQRKGVVQGQTPQPRSYSVSTEQGEVGRNRTHLVPLPGQPEPSTSTVSAPQSSHLETDTSTDVPTDQQCTDTTHWHTKRGRCVIPPRKYQA